MPDHTTTSQGALTTHLNSQCNTIMEYESEDGQTDATSNIFASGLEPTDSKDFSVKNVSRGSVARYNV